MFSLTLLSFPCSLRFSKHRYSSGRMVTGDLKQLLITCLKDLVTQHQKARAAVTDEQVAAFMAVRRMQF